MVEFTNREELEAWLEGRPREDAVLIAARAALRDFPLFARVIELYAEEFRAAIILPVCRAMAVACVAGTWPTLATEVRDAAYTARAPTASAVASRTAVYSSRISAVSDAANAADIAAAAASVDVAAEVFQASPFTAAHADANAVANAVAVAVAEQAVGAAYARIAAIDATELEHGLNHAVVAAKPLWAGRPLRFLGIGRIGSTSKPPDEIGHAWMRLRSHLERAGDDWHVWVDWYQGRLDGKPANKELELAKALIPDELWKKGPAVVNAEIARLIEKFRGGEGSEPDETEEVEPPEPESEEPASENTFAPPDPKPSPVRMAVDDGVLRIHRPDSEQIGDIARDGWAALCEEIDELARQIDGKSGNNELLPHLRRAQRGLGDTFDDFNAIRFGLAALTIEQFAQEAENLGMLMPEQAAPLRSIVLQKNLMLRHSPEWSAYVSEIEAPIADAETEQEAANLATEISREIANEHADVVPPETSEVLEELAAATEVEPSPDNPDAIAPPEARRSWLRAFTEEMRAFALDIIAEYRKQVVKGVAATAATGSIAIVTSVSTKLLGLADKLPQEYGWLKDLVYYAASLVGA